MGGIARRFTDAGELQRDRGRLPKSCRDRGAGVRRRDDPVLERPVARGTAPAARSSSRSPVGSGIVLAVAVMLRPWRAVLAAGAVAYAAFIVVWLASGPSSSFVELSQLGIEIALVVACAAALAWPALGRRWNRSTFAFLSVVPVGVLALATAAVVNPPTVSSAAAPRAHATKTANASVRTPVKFASGLSDTGNADEQAELKPDVPLSAADQKLLAQQLVDRARRGDEVPDRRRREARGHDPRGRDGARRRRALPLDRDHAPGRQRRRLGERGAAGFVHLRRHERRLADHRSDVRVAHEQPHSADRVRGPERPLAPALQPLHPVPRPVRSWCRSRPTPT